MPAPRLAARLAVPVLAVLALAACVDQPEPADADGTPVPTASPTATVTDVPVPTETPDEDEQIPVEVACGDLVSADTVYAFNPNFVLLDDWTADAGSAAEAALDRAGVACRWINQTSGDTIDVSVAALPETELRDLANAAYTESQMVPTYGVEGYFEVEGGRGTAIAFDREYWIVATSPVFLEPGEATAFVESALAALS